MCQVKKISAAPAEHAFHTRTFISRHAAVRGHSTFLTSVFLVRLSCIIQVATVRLTPGDPADTSRRRRQVSAVCKHIRASVGCDSRAGDRQTDRQIDKQAGSPREAGGHAESLAALVLTQT